VHEDIAVCDFNECLSGDENLFSRWMFFTTKDPGKKMVAIFEEKTHLRRYLEANRQQRLSLRSVRRCQILVSAVMNVLEIRFVNCFHRESFHPIQRNQHHRIDKTVYLQKK
jgi:hypothetical protein